MTPEQSITQLEKENILLYEELVLFKNKTKEQSKEIERLKRRLKWFEDEMYFLKNMIESEQVLPAIRKGRQIFRK